MTPVSDIAVFVSVVEEGTFTAAAEALDLSKGAVSKYVSRLEKRLGARLLNRTTRRVTLTEIGEAFYGRAARALADLGSAAARVSEQAGSPRGHLKVTAPALYGAEVLTRRLCDFRRRYPGITLDLNFDNRLVDLVAERVDVAIRMSAPEDSSMVMRRIADIPLVAAASPAYLEKKGRPARPEDLRDHDCVIYTLSSRPHEWPFVNADGQRYTVHVEGQLAINDDLAMRQFALDGLGIVQMPRILLQGALERGELVPLWDEAECATVTFAVLYPSRYELPAKVRLFVDWLVDIGGGLLPAESA